MWSADSRDIFYLGVGEGRPLWAATIVAGAPPRVTNRRRLFDTPNFAIYNPANPRSYHIAPDGRLLMMRPPGAEEEGLSGGITVVINFFEELRERAPN